MFISSGQSRIFRQKFVIPTFGISVNFILVLFQLRRNRGVNGGYPILSWNEIQTQVNHALNTIMSYLQSSNVLWCPTLVLSSQTRFFYYFLVGMVTMMIINISQDDH